MRVDKLFLFILTIFLISFISAQLNTGYESDNSLTVSLTKPTPSTNYSLINVNNSDYLDGQHGSYYTGYCDTALGNYVPYTGATGNVDLGNKNLTTTGKGRFDGGIGIGIEPRLDPNNPQAIYINVTNKEIGVDYRSTITDSAIATAMFYNEMYIKGIGSHAIGLSNHIFAYGQVAFAWGMKNDIQVNGSNAFGHGMYNEIKAYDNLTNQNLYGFQTYVTPDSADDVAFGSYIAEGASTINNPTGEQIGLYLDWSINGTDVNNKRWAFKSVSNEKSAFGGNVSIGKTTKPTQALDVNGSINFSGKIYGDGSLLTGISSSSEFDLTLDPSLVSWWRMDDTNGTTTIIDYANRNNGTLKGNAIITDSGYIGKAVNISADADSIQVVNSSSLNPDIFTISAWVRQLDFQVQTISYIMSKGGNTNGWGLGVIGTNPGCSSLDGGLYLYNGSSITCGDIAMIEDSWNHIVFSNNGTHSRFWVNGAVGTVTAQVINNEALNNLSIGGRVGDSLSFLNGSIDDVMFFNRTLSNAEVLQLYQKGVINTTSQADFSYWNYIASKVGAFWNLNAQFGNINYLVSGVINATSLTATNIYGTTIQGQIIADGGITDYGDSCTITELTNGIVTGATCT